MGFLIAFGRKSRVDEACDLGLRCRLSSIKKPRIFDFPGFGVVALADDLGQLADGITSHTTDQTRMHIFGVRFEFEEKCLQAAQAVWHSRLFARNPNR